MIYPRDFSLRFLESEENTAFVIMPFLKEFEEVYGEICQICLELRIDCKRADEIITNRAIMENILERIAKSEIIIADLTEKNPNVFYEVGVAHSLRDQDCVILITQNLQNSPFDINHRSILVYDKRNMMKFRNDLKKRVLFSRGISRKKDFFKSYLINNSIKKSEVSVFIEISDKLSQSKLELMHDIVKQSEREYEESEIESLFDFFTQLEDYQAGILKKTVSILKMSVFTSPKIVESFPQLVKKILVKSNLDLIQLDDSDKFNFISEFCFKLIEMERLKSDALNWLMDYLNNYRMGRIDIVRSKIENFFIDVIDKDVDIAVIEMLSSKKITVRESAADICGQKKLSITIPLLIDLIKLEENPHVVRSCITALVRMSAAEAAPTIFEWMIKNKDKWGDQAVSASLQSITAIALRELDHSKKYLAQFENFVSSK